MTQIAHLRDAIAASQLLQNVEADDGFVVGSVRFQPAAADIPVNVDPELADNPVMDTDTLIANTQRFLAMPVDRWKQLIDEIALEVEEAVEDDEVDEPRDLRDDLRLHSVAVFADAVLLSFVAPQQFPDCWVRAQLGVGLALEDISIDENDGVETIEFKSLDDLLDKLSAKPDE
ncbi:hypothetical protein M2375_003192 [Comamonas sp. BIGb0152]|uniref:hypothetical protein n=1 Tax=Comamonas sp. BIGb0152 TaxID=2940601 RepID=UPI00216911F3|nr:hypothetical protein [Comamonas sp. BIGb0152]MCS4294959.1 hypothetical protein [Comamonas sp. BIGb0152]